MDDKRDDRVCENGQETGVAVHDPKAGWMTTKKERRDYGLYFAGQNVIYTLVNSFLSTFLLMREINPTQTAPVLLIVKAWDAVNDVIFGGIFDKFKFKSGKFMPWLRISVVFIPVATITLFTMPSGWGIMGKLVWFAAMYILWDTAYTLCDVPLYGMITTMTSNLQERTSIMSYSKLYTYGGTAVGYLLGTVLISTQAVDLLGGNAVGDFLTSFTGIAVVCAVAGLATMLPVCFSGKERNYTEEEKEQEFTFRQMFRYMLTNKYLLIFYGAYLLSGCLNTSNGLILFTSYYLFGEELFSLLVSVLGAVPLLILALVMPKLIQKYDKFTMFYWGSVGTAIFGLIIYFVGYSSPVWFIILNILKCIPMGFTTFLVFMFTPDCAEYGRYHSGTDARGITFAIQTFSAKLTGSVGSSLGLFLVGIFGFKTIEASNFQDLAASGYVQSQQALDGLWTTYALIPAIGAVLAAILLSFYKLNDRDVQIMSECNAGKITREEAEQSLSRKY